MNQNNIKPQELRATDLRIGNLMYYKNTKDIAKVELIHNKHFDCRDEYGNFTPNGNYEPIPLSEEVLLRCGFKNLPNSFRPEGNFIHFSVGVVLEKGVFYFRGAYDDFNIIIHSLNQLQNLFYSITGEELEVRWT